MLTTQEAMFCPTANRAGRPRNAVLDHKNILPHNPIYYTSTAILINTIFDHETCLARGEMTKTGLDISRSGKLLLNLRHCCTYKLLKRLFMLIFKNICRALLMAIECG